MIRIYPYGEVPNQEIFARTEPTANVSDIVTGIIQDVRRRGDEALLEYTKKFDKAELTNLQVTEEEFQEALSSFDPRLKQVLQRAASNISKFHSRQKRNSFILNEDDGIVMGQKVIPIDRVGLYVPGGTAAYPSTVLMDTLPARIAGVKEIVMVTPPNAQGKVNPAILAAARIAGVDKIFKVGGAQAIAALAYGTESIPKVDKIVGPGNAFVAEAKRQVYGQVSIDMIAGPVRFSLSPTARPIPATWLRTFSPRRSTTSWPVPCLSPTPWNWQRLSRWNWRSRFRSWSVQKLPGSPLTTMARLSLLII